MKKFILITLAIFPVTAVFAQKTAPASTSSPAPTVLNATPATTADVEALRQQVESLTETVKTLQQQVKDQQAALERQTSVVNRGYRKIRSLLPLRAPRVRPRPLRARHHVFQRRTHQLFHRRLRLPKAPPLPWEVFQPPTPQS